MRACLILALRDLTRLPFWTVVMFSAIPTESQEGLDPVYC